MAPRALLTHDASRVDRSGAHQHRQKVRPDTTHYYVMTAVNGSGETVASLEFNATPATIAQSIQVNLLPTPLSVTWLNVYRGTAHNTRTRWLPQ